MYTKLQFAKDLKKRALDRQDVTEIGRWAYSIYLDWPDPKDVSFLNFLLDLSTMELGEEFAFTYEELEGIANDLINGEHN